MHLVTSARIKLSFLPRIILAVVLVLALLSGIAPFKSASAGNLCTMACCAGLLPHAAGSCHMEMPTTGKLTSELAPQAGSDELCGLPKADKGATGVIKAASGGVMGMTTSGESSFNLNDVTVDAPDDATADGIAHCQVDSQGDAAAIHGSESSDQTASIAASSFTKPCPPECGNGATVSRVRRSPDAATVAQNARPRCTFVKEYVDQSRSVLVLSAYREQFRPRGPPVCLS